MINRVSYLFFALFLICGNLCANVTNDICLKFKRTGTDVASVQVSVVNKDGTPIEGATATLTSSHDFLPTVNNITENIVCPNANGNTSPYIQLTFSLSGLPSGFVFNQVGLDVHAVNAKGSYQGNNDGHARQFTVKAQTGTSATALHPLGELSNIDIAAGIGEPNSNKNVHKVWTIEGTDSVKTEGNAVISLDITSGAKNEGCFFGISEIILSSAAVVKPEPEPQPEPGEGKIYTLSWKNNTSDYMSEEADGSIVTASYDISQRIFWRFIPTGKTNCYYIQNTATNRYIGSCNQTPGSSSFVKTGNTPVEYYLGKTTQNNSEIVGCHYLSSTDCPNYDNESSGPLALNKDKVSGCIITWQAGTNRVGSYWTLKESEDLYEIRPFQPSAAIGNPSYIYMMSSAKGKALTMKEDGSLTWGDKKNSDEQTWYFVGTSNHNGGYLLVNLKSNKVYSRAGEKDTRWNIMTNADGYFFRPSATPQDASTTLKVEGDSLLLFQSVHSKLQRRNQVYEYPCGSLGSQFVENLSITGEGITPMYFPLPAVSDNQVTLPQATRPNTWYTLFTRGKAIVSPNQKFMVNIHLSAAPMEGQEGFLYFDWDRDGVFEVSQKINLSQTSETEVTVPADAKLGKSRMRFRLTDNGMTYAEDEVTGQIFDCMLQTVAATDPVLTVRANREDRGSVSHKITNEAAKTCEVTATPKGDAAFICWREGNNILSLDKNYAFTLNHNMTLTAYFSPNTKGEITGIEEQMAEKNQLIHINADQKQIQVVANSKIEKVLVFTPNGTLVAQSASASVNLAGCPTGAYIVKVYTQTADETAKVLLK